MKWEIEERDGRWYVHGGPDSGFTTYQDALAFVAERVAEHLASAPQQEGRTPFRSELIPEGDVTSDGRMFDEGAAFWRTPPLPLMLQTKTDIGHFGAELAGSIESIAREGNTIVVRGTLDPSDAGQQAVEILEGRGRFGISADLGQMEVEWRSEDGEGLEEDDLIDILFGEADDAIMAVTSGEIIGATMTPFPAFAEAFIELDGAAGVAIESEGGEDGAETEEEPEAVAASSNVRALRSEPSTRYPLRPPAEWFADPEFEQATPFTVTREGRVFGHVATWDSCHVGMPDRCTPPPRSATDYSYYLTGALEVEGCDCDTLPVGTLTLGSGHPDIHLGFRAAIEHYDNTGTAVADVNIGEDHIGPWVAGALRPNVTDEQLRELRAASLSGDWRPIAGTRELVAIAFVNVPGFPIPRPRARFENGRPVAMVAAGVLRQPSLQERAVRTLASRVMELEEIVGRFAPIEKPLRELAAGRLRERVGAGRS